jgi:hypothetical protein
MVIVSEAKIYHTQPPFAPHRDNTITFKLHTHANTCRVGKLSFREYDDTVPMAQSTSFSESLSKEADAIPLEEKSDLL